MDAHFYIRYDTLQYSFMRPAQALSRILSYCRMNFDDGGLLPQQSARDPSSEEGDLREESPRRVVAGAAHLPSQHMPHL